LAVALGHEVRSAAGWVFPGLDVIFRLAAPAVEVLVEGTAAAVAEGGDDEAGIGAVAAGLSRATMRRTRLQACAASKKLLESADLASARIGLETSMVLASRAPSMCWSGRGRRFNNRILRHPNGLCYIDA
jgi:hypothetical protein